MHKVLKSTLAFVVLIATSQAFADDDYAKQWGPVIGTALPAIQAPDEAGEARDFANLAGKNGLLILFNRSADW